MYFVVFLLLFVPSPFVRVSTRFCDYCIKKRNETFRCSSCLLFFLSLFSLLFVSSSLSFSISLHTFISFAFIHSLIFTLIRLAYYIYHTVTWLTFRSVFSVFRCLYQLGLMCFYFSIFFLLHSSLVFIYIFSHLLFLKI